METSVHYMVAEDDLVVAFLTHVLRPTPPTFSRPRINAVGGVPNPLGDFEIHWDAMGFFKLKHGKIVEEWIARDDKGIDLQLGTLTLTPFFPHP